MFEPVRGGTRGGQAEFKWSDVAQDKDRENYLGHSINAPTGRWQKNKDIHWYQRQGLEGEDERREELKRIKEAEAEALAAALGFAPGHKASDTTGVGTGANAIAGPVKAHSIDDFLDPDKAERRRQKAQKKEEKRLKKEKRRAERRGERGYMSSDEEERRRYRRSRSHSPRPRDSERTQLFRRDHADGRNRESSGHYARNRSRSPHPRRNADLNAYDEETRNRERERDRRRWNDNVKRDKHGMRWSSD